MPSLLLNSAKSPLRRVAVWCVFGILGFSALVAILYATLPFWLPPDWIRQRLAQQLSRDLNCPVSIGRISLSWGSGIQLNDVVVRGSGPESGPALARTRSIRTSFDPLRLLIYGATERLSLNGVDVFLDVAPDGRLRNLPVPAAGTAPNPRFAMYDIRDVSCHVLSESGNHTTRMDRIECRLDPDTGFMRLQAAAGAWPGGGARAVPAGGLFMMDAGLTLARLHPDKPFGGSVHLSWKGLALSDLPLALLPRLPVAQLDGLTSGELSVTPKPDLSMDFDLRLRLDEARMVRDASLTASRGVDADLRTTGHWDPADDQIELTEFAYETPGLRLHKPTAGCVLAIDSQGVRPFHLRLGGHVKDWAALAREMPELSLFLSSSGADVSGQADFTLELQQQRQEDRLVLSIDAKDTQLAIGPDKAWVRAPAGVSKSLYIETIYSESKKHLSQPMVRLALGGSTLTIQSDLALPTTDPADRIGWLADAAQRLSWRMMFNTNDVAQIGQYIPAASHQETRVSGRGPLRLAALLEPHSDVTEFRISFDAPEQTSLDVADWFHKPQGQRLDAMASLSIPRGRAEFNLKGEAAVGDLSISLKDAPIRYRLGRTERSTGGAGVDAARSFDAEAIGDIALHATNVEKLALICPRLSRIVPTQLSTSGSVDLESRLHFSRHDQDWALCSVTKLNGRSLALHDPALVHKPVDEPLDIALTHRVSALNGQREQSASFDVHTRPVSVTGQIDFAGMDSKGFSDDFEQAQLTLDVQDAAGALAMVPGLSALLPPSETSGRIRIQLSDLLVGASENVMVLIDATHADLRVAGEAPFHKRAGIPAVAELFWTGVADASDPSFQKWTLERGRLEIPGLRATHLEGQASVSRSDRSSVSVSGLAWRRSRPAALRSARLVSRGMATFDGPLADMSPSVRALIDKYHLNGQSEYALEFDVTPHRIQVNGKLSADQISFVADLDSPSAPLLRKPAGMPGAIGFQAEISRAADGDLLLRLQRAEVELGRNKADCTGTLFIANNSGVAFISRATLGTHFSLSDPPELSRLLPDSTWRIDGGSCEGDLQFGGTSGAIAARAGHVIFKKLLIRTPAEPVRLDGALSLDGDRVLADQLKMKWGPSDVTLSGALAARSDRSRGHITASLVNFDLPDLQNRLARLSRADGASSARKTSSDAGPDLRTIVDYLRNSELSTSASAGAATFDLPLGVAVTAEAGTMRAEVGGGNVGLRFQGMVNGGMVSGQVTSDLNSDDPKFHLTYTAEKIQPSPLVDRYLGLTFPGMKATGPLTLIDETTQKLFPAPGELNFPVGTGEIIIDGGTIEGKAAPDWLTKIFPKLNLSSFDFTYMHSWFTKTVDGRIRHQMIYRGKFYNIYASGHGEDDGHIDYEVGIDFLADFDSRYWAESGQGRVPLFHKTGIRNASGQLDNEVVNYTSPQRILDALLVKNNPLVTAYHAVRKRVLHEQ